MAPPMPVKMPCTSCAELVAPAITFPTCRKHRLCKSCLPRWESSNSVQREQCPICDQSRRRLAAHVRSGIWTEQTANKIYCVSCEKHVSGSVMKCGHSYCVPCLRKLPRTYQSRTVKGDMARNCQDCEKRIAEELREEAREATERAEEAARSLRDERETVEMRRDLKALKLNARKKAAAPPPPPPPPRQTTIPVGPSFLETNAQGNLTIAKPVWKKLPVPKPQKAPEGPKDKRRVSFDPTVKQRLISPRPAKPRLSLPSREDAGPARYSSWGSAPSDTALFRATGAAPNVPQRSEPKTPVEKLRFNSRRSWGVNSP